MAYRILIVDDSEIIRYAIKKSIGMSGLKVSEILEAGNGEEALGVMNDEWVDVVFADLNMPQMSGDEMVVKMSEDKTLSEIPVIIVSSERNKGRIGELEKLGINGYIKKPFRPENFRDVVVGLFGSEGE